MTDRKTLTSDQDPQHVTAHRKARETQIAEWLHRAILKAHSRHPDANYNLGILAVQEGQPVAGLPYLKTALEADPGQDQYWLSYIDALIRAGQPVKARQVLQHGLKRGLKREAVDALERRLKNDAPAAEVAIDHAPASRLHRAGEPSRERIDQLVALYKSGQLRSAETRARELIRKHRDTLILYDVLGAALAGQGRLDEAVASCRKALKIKPDYAEAHNNLGAYLREIGRLDEAIASCRKALKIKPDYAEAHDNLGNVLRDLGRLNEAVASHQRALAIMYDDAIAHRNLGNVLRDLGRLDEAAASYEQALKIKPDYAEVRHLAAALSGETTRTAPDEYVINLFDDYANKFDKHLVNDLEYHIPRKMLDLVRKTYPDIENFGQIIDLGCGTGLCGAEFRPFSDYLCGVDLSEKMLLKAKEKNIYDELARSNIVEYLHNKFRIFDFFLSTDVFIYLGELEDVFGAILNRASPNAKFGFSVEKFEGDDFRLLPSGRYSHSEQYIKTVAGKHGFRQRAVEETIVRTEKNIPIPGQIFILEKQTPR